MKHPESQHCRFHSHHPARWFCDACTLSLCTDCKPFAEQLPLEVACPLCGRELQDVEPTPDGFVGSGGLLTTPLNPVALALIVLAAAAALVPWPVPGIVVALPVVIAFLAYAAVLARAAAEGNEALPTTRELRDIDQLEHAFQTLAFGVPFIVLLMTAVATGSLVLLAVSIAAVGLLLPAVLMATIISGSAIKGFSPEQVQRVMTVLGPRYIPLAGVTLAPAATLAVAAVSLAPVVPLPLLATILTAIAGWLVLAWSRYIGQELHRHRRRLDYAAGVPPIDRPRPPDPLVYEPAQLVADADALLCEGRKRDARLHLGQALTRYPDDPELNRRFDELVRQGTTAKEFANHLERRMQRLIKHGQISAATDLWQRNSPTLSNWLPKVTETRYRLALELDERGEHQTAFRLLISLPPDDRKARRLAHAWTEAARILETHLDDPDRASELRLIAAEKGRQVDAASRGKRKPTPTNAPAARARKRARKSSQQPVQARQSAG